MTADDTPRRYTLGEVERGFTEVGNRLWPPGWEEDVLSGFEEQARSIDTSSSQLPHQGNRLVDEGDSFLDERELDDQLQPPGGLESGSSLETASNKNHEPLTDEPQTIRPMSPRLRKNRGQVRSEPHLALSSRLLLVAASIATVATTAVWLLRAAQSPTVETGPATDQTTSTPNRLPIGDFEANFPAEVAFVQGESFQIEIIVHSGGAVSLLIMGPCMLEEPGEDQLNIEPSVVYVVQATATGRCEFEVIQDETSQFDPGGPLVFAVEIVS